MTKDKTTKHKYNKIQTDKIQIWHNTNRQKANMTKYKQVLLRQKTKMTKHKKTYCKCDKMQTDKIQIWQNAKGQITNVTKYKTKYYKYHKIIM